MGVSCVIIGDEFQQGEMVQGVGILAKNNEILVQSLSSEAQGGEIRQVRNRAVLAQ